MSEPKAVKVTVEIEVLNGNGAAISRTIGYAVTRTLPAKAPEAGAVARDIVALLKAPERKGKAKATEEAAPAAVLGEPESETPIEAYGGPDKDSPEGKARGPFYTPGNI